MTMVIQMDRNLRDFITAQKVLTINQKVLMIIIMANQRVIIIIMINQKVPIMVNQRVPMIQMVLLMY